MMFRWCFGVDIFAQMVYWNRLPNTIRQDVDNGVRPLARLPPRASAISQHFLYNIYCATFCLQHVM